MAHCPPDLLDDLAGLFAELRTWAGVVEKTPGVFSVRRAPFLHFHRTEAGGRRADIKTRDGWVQHDLPRPISTTRQRTLLRELRRRWAGGEPEPLSTPAARRRSGRTAASRRGCPRDDWRRRES